ncbi:sialate O-acetylesterase [Algoriphagus hitonicola]|uniref:Sialate O-acetylesterase n=1 Tax=Algoriphagus hitonicola TaxID=435880 RepID=A0A1I2TUQ8_9BACT|nr:sialate O-acetylesterase [Algoriphagus hitonicola]SFG68618.1 sialate O-acetylesterase [Algoriphagus hitonicola]
MKNLLFLLIVIFIGACQSKKFESEVELPKLISDGMILQRDQPVKIWGKGIPGKNVRVSVAGSISSSKVEKDSTWIVTMPSNPAGGPHLLTVNQEEFDDVYFGDVWVAGGQSNMEWPLKSGVVGAEDEIKGANFDQIRFYKVPNSYSVVQQKDLSGGEWVKADSTTLADFSAIAWFFAKQNHLEKEVPVGIIESNWGGTPAEGWTPTQILAGMEDMSFSEEANEILAEPEKWERENLANEKRREMRDLLVHHPDSTTAAAVSSVGYNDSQWRKIQLPQNNPLEHIAWVRRDFNLSQKSELSLFLPDINEMAYIFINGVQIHHKDWGESMPEVKVNPELLFVGQNTLTIRVVNNWNNQPQVGTKGSMYFSQNGNKINLEGIWSYSNDLVEPQLPKVDRLNWKPGMMYNAMIHPLTNYGIRGVIWYQGESNAGRAEEYNEVFTTLIQSWRQAWDQGEFPFLYVQLANFMEPEDLQPESNWAALREAQRKALVLPNTGMAVAIDLGEAEDIHPRNKRDVGDRLWRLARNISFLDSIVSQGPILDSVEKAGSELRLFYSSVGSGLEINTGEEVIGFSLQNQDEQWQSFAGRIIEKDQIIIDLDSEFDPIELRYAWADNPKVNLYNSENLPAVPIRLKIR